MDETLHIPRKALVEVAVVMSVYLLFLVVGLVSGQTTMTVEIVGPPDGATLRHSPVQLIARITIRGIPVPNVTVSFFVTTWGQAGREFDMISNTDGIAIYLVAGSSGNYTWHASASKADYPTINSRSNSFSINLSLTVEPLSPSTTLLAMSPVDFRARVTDMKDQVVESANVTFYADTANIGFALTASNGIARLSKPLASGMHTWFASATKDDEGGISVPTQFLVGTLASFQGNLVSLRDRLNAREPIFDGSHENVIGSGFPVKNRYESCLVVPVMELGYGGWAATSPESSLSRRH
jgi:hypothetical protein